MSFLPTTATAPFCPSEVKGSITIDARASRWLKLKRFFGPGLLVAIGYMDPGNWATDIQAGSQFGYALLWVVAFSSVAAIFLQMLAARLGLVAGKDLAQASYERYGRFGRIVQWVTAEVSIIACDIAEVLGCALAFKLLLGVPLAWGIVLTALDTLIVLGLQGKGFRQIEAIVLGLIATMAFCFVAQVAITPPNWHAVAAGLVPGDPGHDRKDAIVLALGIVGATIMPHNLYLHSSVVQTRHVVGGTRGGTFVERAAYLQREFEFSVCGSGAHSVIPLALSACARVWVAREQCVLTLPSEQPIAAAVSATSISSQ